MEDQAQAVEEVEVETEVEEVEEKEYEFKSVDNTVKEDSEPDESDEDEEDYDEDESDEDDSDDAEDEQATTFEEVELSTGEKIKVPKEVKDGMMMQADYTQKTQAVAESKKTQMMREEQFNNIAQNQQANFGLYTELATIDKQLKE